MRRYCQLAGAESYCVATRTACYRTNCLRWCSHLLIYERRRIYPAVLCVMARLLISIASFFFKLSLLNWYDSWSIQHVTAAVLPRKLLSVYSMFSLFSSTQITLFIIIIYYKIVHWVQHKQNGKSRSEHRKIQKIIQKKITKYKKYKHTWTFTKHTIKEKH